MKRLSSLIFCFTMLIVTIVAQNSSSPRTQPELEFGKYIWAELGLPGGPCNDCAGLPQVSMDYRWKSRKLKYMALAEVRNTSTKTIKSLDLDFAFMDAVTMREFLRYHVHSDLKINPGRMKEIRKFARDVRIESNNYEPANPSQEVLTRANSALLKLIVTRIEYTDGSVWQLP